MSIEDRIRKILADAKARLGIDDDEEDDDPDSLVRAPLKPKPYSGAAAIALKEPDPPEEEA
jgi:hypothetical protein